MFQAKKKAPGKKEEPKAAEPAGDGQAPTFASKIEDQVKYHN